MKNPCRIIITDDKVRDDIKEVIAYSVKKYKITKHEASVLREWLVDEVHTHYKFKRKILSLDSMKETADQHWEAL